MLRGSYIGDAATLGGSSVPTQPEALAYFARMTVAPSKAYREAVNLAILKWKAQGTWALLKGLWLFCAETDQAALLSVIGDAPRDATKTGTPTFVAGKGYEGFSSTAGITWPITAAILANDNFAAVFAGRIQAGSGNFIISDAGAVDEVQGHFRYTGDGVGGGICSGRANYPITPGSDVRSGMLTWPFCAGQKGLYGLTAGGPSNGLFGITGAGVSSNYRINHAANTVIRLTAIAYLGSAVTLSQATKFISTLNEMLSDLGALD